MDLPHQLRSVDVDVDVAVVGFGPVGKLLTIQLGRRGHRVVVLDRNEVDYPLPRAVTHCAEFARILQSVGLAPASIPEITEPYDDMYIWRNGAGQTLLEVDWSGRDESGWYNTYFFSQPALEQRLNELVAALPSVRVLRGWEATGIDQDGAVAVRDLRTGEETVIGASWVVGADGANSRVRQWGSPRTASPRTTPSWSGTPPTPSRPAGPSGGDPGACCSPGTPPT